MPINMIGPFGRSITIDMMHEASGPITLRMSDGGSITLSPVAASLSGLVVGTAAGAATVSGVGASIASGAGAANGLSVVSGAGGSIATSIGSAEASSAVSGAGHVTSESTGSATGSATVSGVAEGGVSVGSSDGVATVSGVGAQPSMAVDCPNPGQEASALVDQVPLGDPIWFSIYLRDALDTQPIVGLTLYRPDGEIYHQWSFDFDPGEPTHYSGAWWWWNWSSGLGNNPAFEGVWTFEASMGGQTVSREFSYGEVPTIFEDRFEQ